MPNLSREVRKYGGVPLSTHLGRNFGPIQHVNKNLSHTRPMMRVVRKMVECEDLATKLQRLCLRMTRHPVGGDTYI
jgi:hypothetical protein